MARSRSPAVRQLRRRLLVAGGILVVLLGLLLVTCLDGEREPARLVVFAATPLTDAADALAREFEAAYPGVEVVVHAGVSSALAQQIEQGAAADVFLSASPEWTDLLRARLRAPAQPLVRNRLVVAGPPEAPRLDTLPDLLRLDRIAVADPSHVPAGRYAREGLERAGLWERLAPRLLPSADSRAALAAVETGAAEVAIVYASDLLAARRARELLAWPDAQAPLIQYTVAVPRDAPNPDRALEFVEWVRQPERARLWRRHGLIPPAEPLAP